MSDYGGTSQPLPRGTVGAQGTPPPNYLAWAICSLLFAWPLAIVAIVFAAQVNGKWGMGDLAGAQNASRMAKAFAILSPIVWVGVLVLWILTRLAVAFSIGFGS